MNKGIKRLSFTVIVIIAFFYLLDRAVKYYDIYMPKKDLSVKAALQRRLTEKQINDYKKATTLALFPYLMFQVNPNFHSDTINFNSLGFRGHEIEPKKDNITRIVVVGGSGAMGYGASSDKTIFTALLENKLNESQNGIKAYEIINAGLASAIAMQEFICISLKIIDLEPDAVIIFDGFNDMVGSVINDRRPGYPWRFAELEKALNISVTKAFIRKRLMNYRPTKKIIEFIERKKSECIKTHQDYSLNPEAVLYYKKTLDRISRLLKSYDINPVFAYQPSVYFKTPKTDFENMILVKESKNRTKILIEMLEQGKMAMQEVAEDNNDLFIDYLPVFNGFDKDIFIDVVHFSDEGQEILAQFLYEKLKDRI